MKIIKTHNFWDDKYVYDFGDNTTLQLPFSTVVLSGYRFVALKNDETIIYGLPEESYVVPRGMLEDDKLTKAEEFLKTRL